MSTIIYDFLDAAEWQIGAGARVLAGQLLCDLVDKTGQTFNENFDNDTGFTYDSAKAEFSAGVLQQKDQRPAGATFGANYGSDINGNWGAGVLTGSAVGGAAVSGGKLDLAHDDLRYVDYDADLNADSQQVGAIKFKLTPNYNGSPSTHQYFLALCKAASDNDNLIQIRHLTTGDLTILIRDQNGNAVQTFSSAWSPTLGTEYEIELNFDITTGATRIFIDGSQLGSTGTATGTRDSGIGLFRIGSDNGGSLTSNFEIDDLIYFNSVQHTSNYTPGYTVNTYIYAATKVENPQFNYSGLGAIQAFTAFATTEAGAPRYTLNGLYWNGAAWAATSDNYATASDAATVAAQIASLPAADDIDIDIYFTDTNTQGRIDDLTLTYTGQEYSQANPLTKPVTPIQAEAISLFLSTLTEPGSDAVKFILDIDGVDMWYTGATWAASSGYAESNTLAEIQANLSTLDLTDGKEVYVGIYLHSDDGSTTPDVTDITIQFTFHGQEDEITRCQVWGHQEDNEDGLQDPIYVSLTNKVALYKNTKLVIHKQKITPTADGHFKVLLPDTVTMDGDQTYTFNFSGKTDIVQVPAKNREKYEDLTFIT